MPGSIWGVAILGERLRAETACVHVDWIKPYLCETGERAHGGYARPPQVRILHIATLI